MTAKRTATIASNRTSTSSILLGPRERAHVGVDAHKATYSVAVYVEGRGIIATWTQPARPEALIDRLRPVASQVACVAYEAGPTGFGLARRLRAAGLPAEVIAPSKLLAPCGPEAKSDRIDCRKLALHAAKGLLHPVRIPTEPEEADRQVFRLRDQLVRKARAAQMQARSFLLMYSIPEPAGLGNWSRAVVARLRQLELVPELRYCLDVLLDEVEHARGQVRAVTKRLRELAGTERHGVGCATLRTVPGVGLVTAMAFRLELPDPGRFAREGQVARMLGLAPQVRQSGQTRHERGLLKAGQARLRTALVEAAWRWVACDEAARLRYRRLVSNTGSGKKAIVGMARRLGVLLWRLSVRGEPYRVAA
jgi:transposase